MQIIQHQSELRQALQGAPRIALVPTMGNLHQGHLSLVQQAAATGALVVVSIYVNPLQFGANEDFNRYPRTLAQDIALLENAGVDVLFVPENHTIYPDFDASQRSTGQDVLVSLTAVADRLCGASRPGHFNGVATVVLKLFNLVFFNGCQQAIALFGKKDFQQLSVIRQMVRQFNLPIEIIAAPTIREPDGLALSSRNGYLSPAQRALASGLYQTLLNSAQQHQAQHPLSSAQIRALEAQAQAQLQQLGWRVDYVQICHPDTLLPAQGKQASYVILGAAYLGETRLIDNIEYQI